MKQRNYGAKARTKEQKKTALVQLLTYAQKLDQFTAEGLAASYGVTVGDAQAMLDREHMQRRLRG